jgi:hypothetical protein
MKLIYNVNIWRRFTARGKAVDAAAAGSTMQETSVLYFFILFNIVVEKIGADPVRRMLHPPFARAAQSSAARFSAVPELFCRAGILYA